jgi:glycerol-3-phosphate dehydrogenase
LAIPWEGVTLFGTTDIDHQLPSGIEPAISSDELDYLMIAVRHGFPDLSLAQSDVQSTMAGIRAVIDTGKKDPSKESREHALWLEDGLLTVTGGKLTTFRVMARDALRLLAKNNRFHLNIGDHHILDEFSADLSELAAVEPATRQRLLGHYGHEAPSLVKNALPEELSPICDRSGNKAIWAELRWAARMEGVVHLNDLMLRRQRLGLLLPNGGRAEMERIRSIVQPELGWNDERWKKEEADYLQNWDCQYSLPD